MKKIFTLLSLAMLTAGMVSAQTPTLTVTTTDATICSAPCDGSATVSPTVGGMTYVWNTTPAQTTATATGLCPGVYTCTVTLSPFGSTTGTGTVTCSAGTGINVITVDDNISLFPNPAHVELTLQSGYELNESVEILIRNMLGATVYQETVILSGYLNRKVDVSALPVGIYDVQLISDTRITRKQFVRE